MSNKSFLLGCVIAVGLAGPALAGDFSGTVTGNYLNADIHTPLGSVSGNGWGGSGEVQGALGNLGVHGQLDGSYNSLSFSGVSGNVWTIDANLYVPYDWGRVGITGGYTHLHGDFGLSGHQMNFGVYGEYWAGDMFTLGAKVGGISIAGDAESDDLSYAGAEAVFYPMPDLALSGSVSTVNRDFGTQYTGGAEFLVSEDMPVSVGGSYTYVNVQSGIHIDTWLAKLTFYFGDDSAKTLVEHHRTGNLGWDVGTSSVNVQY